MCIIAQAGIEIFPALYLHDKESMAVVGPLSSHAEDVATR